jgi:anaerobic selenocysteine-containing dehydrogenase
LLDGTDVRDPSVRVLDQCRLGSVLAGTPQDLAGGPPVTAMLIQNTNPMAVAPDSGSVRHGLSREDLFVCVHEQFMTETARMADIVLPATTFLEHDDIYQSSAHTFLQVARAVIPPIGQSRPNHYVNCQLAKRLGARHPGFEMTEWELIDAVLKASGKPAADAVRAARGVDCLPPFDTAHFLDGFPQPGGRFRFAPDWAAIGPHHAGMPALPDHLAITDETTADRPFRLVAAPSRHFLNTSFTETPTSQRLEERPEILVHSAVCERLSLRQDDLVRIGNDRGSVLLPVRPTNGIEMNTVVVESVWPNGAFIEGRGINTLVSADPAWPAGGGVFHDTAVWLQRA